MSKSQERKAWEHLSRAAQVRNNEEETKMTVKDVVMQAVFLACTIQAGDVLGADHARRIGAQVYDLLKESNALVKGGE